MLILDAMEEFCLECKVKKYSPRMIRNYHQLVKLISEWLARECNVMQLEQIKPIHLKRFMLAQEEKGRKPHYINDLLKTYKVFLKYCVQEGYIGDNAANRISWVKQPKVLIRSFNSKEIRDLLSFYDGKDYLSMRNKTMLAVFFDTGMRLNEVLTLRREQIMGERILVHGKGNKERMVPLSPFLSKQMLKYIRTRDAFFANSMTVEPYVFLSRTGRKITPEAVRKFMIIAAKEVGVRPEIRVSPHTCRHTFAHKQLENGLDIYSLSRLMGHENIAITQRYLQGIMTDEVLKKARDTGVLANL